MATASPPKTTNPKQASVVANLARVDPGRLSSLNTQLPVDVLSDLHDSFQLFDKDQQGVISIQQFKNILHNFGFSRLSLKEYNDDLKKLDPDFGKRTGVDFEFLRHTVAQRHNMKSTAENDAKECFKLFDKRERNFINAADIKAVLSDYLEFAVSDQEIQEILLECDKNGTGTVNFSEFKKLYLA